MHFQFLMQEVVEQETKEEKEEEEDQTNIYFSEENFQNLGYCRIQLFDSQHLLIKWFPIKLYRI